MESNFLRACRRKSVKVRPIWFMRQAGRYLPKYRVLREGKDVLSLCKNPELLSEISVTPVKELKVDACILFADIMLLLEAMKVPLELKENLGPIIHRPIVDLNNFNELMDIDLKSLDFLSKGIKLTKKKLGDLTPLIGLSGAPFTLASYLIEGKPSKDFLNTKRIMYSKRNLWDSLMEKLSQNIVKYISLQLDSGVDALQIFDSWAICLSPRDYKEFVFPYTNYIFEKIKGRVPTIYFSLGSSTLLDIIKEMECDVISLDWRINIGEAWKRIDYSKAIQGNLDPAHLLSDEELLERRVKEILRETSQQDGHIFNLGHGVLPHTDPEKLKKVVSWVHKYRGE